MAHRLIYNTLARVDLLTLYDYIEERNGPGVAGGYLDRIEALCPAWRRCPSAESIGATLGLGIRSVSMERRVLIVYRPAAETVEILRVIYAGRDLGADDLPR